MAQVIEYSRDFEPSKRSAEIPIASRITYVFSLGNEHSTVIFILLLAVPFVT